ncbi:MAG: substrate-binding domain-containing protein [Ruminococcus sp.]
MPRLRVPKDVSVIGCDNIFYSGIRRVSLTTIDHFVDLKGRDACDIIIRKIDTGIRFGKASVPQVYIILSIIPRLLCEKPPVMHVWINRIP